MTRVISDSDPLARQVRSLARREVLPHAVILTGSGEPLASARYLAAAMLCRSNGDRPCLRCAACRKVLEDIHPDVRTVQDESRKELSVETVRQLRQDVYIRPNEAERKVYLFADAEQLNERDQNVLLKIVEEGPAYAAFVFCAGSSAELLPTIRSRCVELKARGADAAPVSDQALELCRAFAGGELLPVAQLLVAWENRRIKREQLEQILQDAWCVCADALLQRCGKTSAPGPAGEVSAALSRTLSRDRLQKLTDCLNLYARECRYNVGPGHVLGAITAQWESILD